MLRRRTMFGTSGGDSGGGGTDPNPPTPSESYIMLDITCDDGSVTFNTNNGITYKKVTTNMTGMAEVLSTANKNLKIDFAKGKLSGGETVIKIKAYVDTVNSSVSSFFTIELGATTWNDSILDIDFLNFDASKLTAITLFCNKSGGMSNLKKMDIKNLNAPLLVDMYNKNEGFWGYSIFKDMFSYDATLTFANCNTPKLNSIKGMFQNVGLKTIDISGLDTSSVTDIERLFDSTYNTSSFKVFYPFGNLTNTADAFTNCTTQCTFLYNKNNDYSKLPIPNGWTKTPY